MCVYLCVNVWVSVCNSNTEEAELNTEDTQLKYYLLSEDEHSGNRGRIHYSTQPPNADILDIPPDPFTGCNHAYEHSNYSKIKKRGRSPMVGTSAVVW